jgi:hypothetical protein
MKRTMTTLGALMAMATPAIAGGGAETEGSSLFIILLLGFGALIVAFQVIPGLFMLSAMIKGILGKGEAKTKPVEDHK